MPAYEALPRFTADLNRLSLQQHRAFSQAVAAFVDDLLAGRMFRPRVTDQGCAPHARGLRADVERRTRRLDPVVAHSPERVPEWTARRRRQIADPQLIGSYRTLGQALDHGDDDPRLVELADELAAYLTRTADEQGEDYVDDTDIAWSGYGIARFCSTTKPP
ncbi:hypothetical protein ACWGOK_41010 [Streptomyces eurythermus]